MTGLVRGELLDAMIKEGLAESRNHARRLLYLLRCYPISDYEALARVRLYKQWNRKVIDGKKIPKETTRMYAIAGKAVPE